MTLLRRILACALPACLAVFLPLTAQEPIRKVAAAQTTAPAQPPESPDPDADNDADMVPAEGELGRDIVITGSDVRIREGEVAHDVLVQGGDVIVEGEVTGDVVVMLGKITILGKVNGDVVNFGRGVQIENGGYVAGQVLAVGYGVAREPDGVVQGQVINLGILALPVSVREQAILFFNECIMMARPLSPRVGFVWILWAGMLFFQGFIALLFPTATQATLRAMRERPGGTTILGIFGLPLVLLAASILTLTLVGTIAVPFLFAAVFIGLLIGRIAILRIMGSRLLRLFGLKEPTPVAEYGVGAAIATLLFLIPVIGIFAWMVLVLWALGAILMALFRRDSSPATTQQAPDYLPPEAVVAAGMSAATFGIRIPEPAMAGGGGNSEGMSDFAQKITPNPESGVFAGPAASTGIDPAAPRQWHEPRQGRGLSSDEILEAPRPPFSRRLGALLIDWVPLLFLIGILPSRFLLVRLDDYSGALRVVLGVAYFATMLTWRGTTLGGLLMGLRVVRLDGRPIDRTVAVVRALAAILSALCMGIGWFWAGWDTRRQTWHDKLAGTVVIRDDHVQPLV